MAGHNVVVVDTDVFSGVYIDPHRLEARGYPVPAWRASLAGKRVLISFQTRAEVLAGFRSGNWGGGRVAAATARMNSVRTIPVDEQVIEAWADLTSSCKRVGHALHQPIHAADRWVAAAAIAKDLPLKSGDGIYRDAPGLTLLG